MPFIVQQTFGKHKFSYLLVLSVKWHSLKGNLAVCIQIKNSVSPLIKQFHFWEFIPHVHIWNDLGFLGGSVVKTICLQYRRRGDTGSIPGLERSPGDENSKPMKTASHSSNPMNRGAWRSPVHGVRVRREWATKQQQHEMT